MWLALGPSLLATVDFESEEAVDYPLCCVIRPLSAIPEPAGAIGMPRGKLRGRP